MEHPSSSPLEFLDPGEAPGLLEQAWAGGVVLDYVPLTSEEDLGESEVLRRVVLFTARGLCVARGLDPSPEIDPSSIPGHRITRDEFYGSRVDRERRRVLMRGDDLVKRDPDRYTVGKYEFGSISAPLGFGPTSRTNQSTSNALVRPATETPSSNLRTRSRCSPELLKTCSSRSMMPC
jgi:hypothetical protein